MLLECDPEGAKVSRSDLRQNENESTSVEARSGDRSRALIGCLLCVTARAAPDLWQSHVMFHPEHHQEALL